MMSLSFAHIILQAFSYALLAVTNKMWLLYYVSASMGLFFFYKIVRRDFYYFLNLRGVFRLVVSIIEVSDAQRILLVHNA